MKHSVNPVVLKNGSQGLFINVPGASVTSYELNFRAGEFLMPQKKWEVPHILEHVISAGANEKYPDRHIFNSEMSKNGADINAYTSYYSLAYVGETADFEWDRVLGLQNISLAKPLFLRSEYDAEFGNIRDELTSYSNNHFRELGREVSKSLGFPVVTDRERIELMENVNYEDLIEHYKNTHFTKNLRFIIAGNLTGRRSAVRQLLESIELPKGVSRHKLPSEKAKPAKQPVFIPNETVPNVYIIISSNANEIIDQKFDDALETVRIMLTETLYSKIFGQARDKGLVYHVSSGHHIASEVTEWFLSAQVLAENAPALCEIVLTEIKKIKNGIIDEADLENAKQYALGSFQRSMQTVQSVANAYGRYFFDGHLEDMRSIPVRIKAMKKHDLAQAMDRMFSEGLGNIGILGGTDNSLADKLSSQLAPLWR